MNEGENGVQTMVVFIDTPVRDIASRKLTHNLFKERVVAAEAQRCHRFTKVSTLAFLDVVALKTAMR